ncbi:hypothetical protein HanXRQr2_Chr17g0828681 [Helianthus annuus]|uniref:Uncharacterized protein n=1 Tax=Helianthus annuus TaxID=4232 RepID=A0A251RW29_HELAN|nr:hypothetical protein HanXRQr2_Chr17g0828681 [Helianthus annuus]
MRPTFTHPTPPFFSLCCLWLHPYSDQNTTITLKSQPPPPSNPNYCHHLTSSLDSCRHLLTPS